MDFGQLYTSTAGRINRKAWWLGTIGLVIIFFILGGVAGGLAAIVVGEDFVSSAFGEGLLQLIFLAVMFVPYRALTVKRLHDRSRPENLFLVWFLPSVVLAVAMTLGLAGSYGSQTFVGVEVEAMQYNLLGKLLNVIALVVGLWSLVELGFLRGDVGANAHGEDPSAV